MIQSFRDLSVWQKSRDLAERVYQSTEQFPRSEMFGLTSQSRRAAVSIPSNIAEGKAVGGQTYPRHIRIAIGSEAELANTNRTGETLEDVGEADANVLLEQASEVGRMLAGLLKSLPRT